MKNGLLSRSRLEDLLAVKSHILQSDKASLEGTQRFMTMSTCHKRGVRAALFVSVVTNGEVQLQYARRCKHTCLVLRKRAGTNGSTPWSGNSRCEQDLRIRGPPSRRKLGKVQSPPRLTHDLATTVEPSSAQNWEANPEVDTQESQQFFHSSSRTQTPNKTCQVSSSWSNVQISTGGRHVPWRKSEEASSPLGPLLQAKPSLCLVLRPPLLTPSTLSSSILAGGKKESWRQEDCPPHRAPAW